MGIPKSRRATYADLVALPDHVVGEILGGELIVSPRPSVPHARASSRLTISVGGPFDRGLGGPGGWVILDEPELHLGPDVLVPDLAGWRRERMPVLPDEAFFTVAPDWICEVLSPSTERIDRARKLALYAHAGVAHAWLLNPSTQTLEVLCRDGEEWRLRAVHEGDARVRAEPFDAIELELAPLWER